MGSLTTMAFPKTRMNPSKTIVLPTGQSRAKAASRPQNASNTLKMRALIESADFGGNKTAGTVKRAEIINPPTATSPVKTDAVTMIGKSLSISLTLKPISCANSGSDNHAFQSFRSQNMTKIIKKRTQVSAYTSPTSRFRTSPNRNRSRSIRVPRSLETATTPAAKSP